ncbi:hypothetical protein [Thalassobacillus hwangdonensis]|uniref:Uncharacterized protein n=1 Tax=Thalassobacillus hwangdonensis TaxID=546108 RepID=A0ABW3KZP7_9BACI
MLIMDRHRMLEEKVGQLMNGHTAYAETDELIRLMKREVAKHELDVYLDQTEAGCWFIPIDQHV